MTSIEPLDLQLSETDVTRLITENQGLRSQIARLAFSQALLWRVYRMAEQVRRPGAALHAALEKAREYFGIPPCHVLFTIDWRKMIVAYARGAQKVGVPKSQIAKAFGISTLVLRKWEICADSGVWPAYTGLRMRGLTDRVPFFEESENAKGAGRKLRKEKQFAAIATPTQESQTQFAELPDSDPGSPTPPEPDFLEPHLGRYSGEDADIE